MKPKIPLVQQNLACANERFGKLNVALRRSLNVLTRQHRLSIAGGELMLLNGNWYITHAGLLRIARRRRCSGIKVAPVRQLSNRAEGEWVFHATVYTSTECRGFSGFGDATPSNVSPAVRGAEMRVAETRAVNRALRKAYGIGICSVEEIGSFPAPPESGERKPLRAGPEPATGNGQHPLRDRLCLLIRKHGLDANLVKLYAADFCDTATLREARREQVQEFVDHLAQYAEHDREGLLCQLNSYAPAPVVVEAPPSEASADSEKAAGAA